MLYIGNQLRHLREGKGLNQRELAEAVDLDVSIISHLENNRRQVNIAHAIKLARFFDLTVDELLTFTVPVPA
jgi:putative transcriptional regulator